MKNKVMPVWKAKLRQCVILWILGILTGMSLIKGDKISIVIIILTMIYLLYSNKHFFKQFIGIEGK